MTFNKKQSLVFSRKEATLQWLGSSIGKSFLFLVASFSAVVVFLIFLFIVKDAVPFFAEKGFKEKDVDAVFVDVPEPWTVIPNAAKALKGGHYLVSWSPNIEQVRSTVETLNEYGFTRIKVSAVVEQEMLVRQQGVRPRERGITHTAYLVRGNKIEIPNPHQ